MNATELAIMEQIAQLDEAQQQKVLSFVTQLNGKPVPNTLSLERWLEQAIAFREQLSAKYGDDHFFGMQSLLDELRESK